MNEDLSLFGSFVIIDNSLISEVLCPHGPAEEDAMTFQPFQGIERGVPDPTVLAGRESSSVLDPILRS